MVDVSPWIVAADADGLLAFLAATFGAEEQGRVPRPDGTIAHAETRLGGTDVVVMDVGDGWSPQPSLLRVRVADLDAVLARAVAAGATVVTERTSLPMGDDVARLTDPWGNLWWVHQAVAELDVTEMLERLSDPELMATVQAFEASLDVEMRRRGTR